MFFLEVVFWATLGLILGSFANVLILRYGMQTLGGRSACPACTRQLRWFELIPVISYLALRGKCMTCHVRISLQYPLVELLMALFTLAIGLSPAPLAVKGIGVLIALLLIAIAVYDLYTTYMPDAWVLGFIGAAIITSIFTLGWGVFSVWFILAGPLVALPLYALWFFSDGRWMGFGDVKFALGIGWLLGIPLGYVALCFAFVIGAIVGVCILLPLQRLKALFSSGITRYAAVGEGFTMKSEVPFGPFLIIGVCICWISLLYSIPLIAILADFLSLNFSS